MDSTIDIHRIKEAQAAFFPDGGRHATHDFHHRTRAEKWLGGWHRHHRTLLGVVAVSFWLAAAVVVLANPGAARFASSGVRELALKAAAGAGREELRTAFDQLPDGERQQVRELLDRK